MKHKMKCEDAQWNAKMCENTKMHDEMQRCMIKCKDAQWNTKMCENMKMHDKMQRCMLSVSMGIHCMSVGKCHEFGISLQGSCIWYAELLYTWWWCCAVKPSHHESKIDQYQPVENWVSTLAVILPNLIFYLAQHMKVVQITSSLNVQEMKLTKLLESILVATLKDWPMKRQADNETGNTSRT